jgi:hypothetical protein
MASKEEFDEYVKKLKDTEYPPAQMKNKDGDKVKQKKLGEIYDTNESK